jgi:hypothetical protein
MQAPDSPAAQVANVNFAVDVRRWVEQAKGRMDLAYREICVGLGESCVLSTRVLTGFARSNWYAELNGNAEGRPSYVPAVRDPTGNYNRDNPQAIIDAMRQQLVNVKAGDRVMILNHAHYILHLEYGTSTMSGDGMVQQTVARADQIASRAVQSVQGLTPVIGGFAATEMP